MENPVKLTPEYQRKVTPLCSGEGGSLCLVFTPNQVLQQKIALIT